MLCTSIWRSVWNGYIHSKLLFELEYNFGGYVLGPPSLGHILLLELLGHWFETLCPLLDQDAQLGVYLVSFYSLAIYIIAENF